MRHDAFIGQVQARARLDSRGSAERVTRASLETLGERVPSTVAEKAAAQLPHEIGEHLRRVAHAPGEPFTGERMTQADFFTRVAERAGTSDVRPSLDAELESVLFAGSSGHT